jgi:hypothetical protein
MENQIFEKRSFWTMLGLSLVTCGIYYIYYLVRTTGQLRRAGNQVPSLWFVFLPSFICAILESYFRTQGLINEFNAIYFILICLKLASYVSAYYFWYNYIKAYCHTIKYNSNSTYVLKYFLTFLAASWASLPIVYLIAYAPVTLYIANHPLIILPIYGLLFAYGTVSTYLLFQKGFNRYVAQAK